MEVLQVIVRIRKNLRSNYSRAHFFDLYFKTTVNKVIVEVCPYAKVGSMGLAKDGCYSDGLRWQSMVNPEKMLAEKEADLMEI